MLTVAAAADTRVEKPEYDQVQRHIFFVLNDLQVVVKELN